MNQCERCPVNVRESCSYIDYSEKCPCTTCLVKMVCDKICRDYIIFQVRVYAKKIQEEILGKVC